MMLFISGNAYREAAAFLYVFNFNESIAETDQFVALEIVFADDAFNDHLLGKGFIIALRAVNRSCKILGYAQKFGLVGSIDLIGAAARAKMCSNR